MSNTSNQRGDKAESLVNLLLNRRLPSEIFRVKFLGDKWPAIDYYVELTNYPGYFFFIQVKSTIRGYAMQGNKKTHLLASASKKSVLKILKINAPTYLVGLDYQLPDYFKSKAYLVGLAGDPNTAMTISQIPISFPLNVKNLKLLEKEVVDFWKSCDCLTNKLNLTSKFS